MNDNLAFNNDFLFSASYAFRIDLGQGSLGIGANVGLANQALTPSWNGADIITPDTDDAIPKERRKCFRI